MSKLTLNDLANLQSETTAVAAINANNDLLEEAFDNTLSRDGDTPNQMGANIDMNSHRIINLPAASSVTEPLRLQDLLDLNDQGVASFPADASNVTFTPGSGVASTNVQDAIEEVQVNVDAVQDNVDEIGNPFVNVKFYGATGDGSTDDTTAISNAIAATPSGGTLFFPAGTYKVVGSGTSVFTRNTPITIKGEGQGSIIAPGATVPNTRDIFTFAPVSSAQGFFFDNFQINNSGSGAGRHAIHFTQSGGANLLYHIRFSNLTIPATSAGGYSIKGTGTAATGGTFAYSTIENCNLESIHITECGDGLTVANNIIGATTAKNTFYAYGVAGAGGLVLTDNVISGTAGFVIIDGFTSPILRGNEMEANVTNTYGFLVDIKSSILTTVAPRLVDNHYTVQAAVGDPVPIRIRTGTYNAYIDEGRINIQTGSHIQIDSGAFDTVWSTNCAYVIVTTIGEPVITDNGTRTVVDSPGFYISLAANQTGTNGNSAQTWFPGGGSTTFNVKPGTYKFEGIFSFARTAGSTSHSTSNLFGGTATISSISYKLDGLQSTSGFFVGTSLIPQLVQTAAQAALFGAMTSTNENLVHCVKGIVRFSGAGTFIPQFIFSAAPGGAPTVQANTFFRMTRIGSASALSNGPTS